VLYIEDDEVSRIVVEQMMSRCQGVRLMEAETGEDGLAFALLAQPDLILLDMQLADMSGFEVLAALRADPQTRALRVVAVSASALPQDVEMAMDLGVLAYWAKPLEMEALLAGVTAILELRPSMAEDVQGAQGAQGADTELTDEPLPRNSEQTVLMHQSAKSSAGALVVDHAWERRAPVPADSQVLDQTWSWLNALPRRVQPVHLATEFPRIANDMAALWRETAALDRYLEDKEFSPRAGRTGFTPVIKEELLTVHLYSMYSRLTARSPSASPSH